jgi:hypothetical protein
MSDDAEILLREMRCQTVYTHIASMPIPLYERIRDYLQTHTPSDSLRSREMAQSDSRSREMASPQSGVASMDSAQAGVGSETERTIARLRASVAELVEAAQKLAKYSVGPRNLIEAAEAALAKYQLSAEQKSGNSPSEKYKGGVGEHECIPFGASDGRDKLAKALQRAVEGLNYYETLDVWRGLDATNKENKAQTALTDIQKILADDHGHRSNDSTNHSEDK